VDLSTPFNQIIIEMEGTRIFRNNVTGNDVSIIDIYGNMAVDVNRQKYDVNQLLNPLMYTEQTGPTAMVMNESRTYNSDTPVLDVSTTHNYFAQLLSQVDTTKLSDTPAGPAVQVHSQPGFSPISNEPAVVMYDEEEERQALMRKYGAVDNRRNTPVYQDEEQLLDSVLKPSLGQRKKDSVETTGQPVSISVDEFYETRAVQPQNDPMVQLFKNTKRSLPFRFSIEIEEKIPRLDFIEMMEDSYEKSIIDYLAQEFTDKVLREPALIRQMIVTELRRLALKEEPGSVKVEELPGKEIPEEELPQVSVVINEEVEDDEEYRPSDVAPDGEHSEGIS